MAGNRVRVLGQAACVGAVFGVLTAAPAAAQTVTPDPPPVKYFIVPHAQNPDDITLFKIAERALGDGRRFPEIFELNRGRTRPDGTPFTDPAAVEPGQVLQLPPDAQDPAVRFGPLPATPRPQVSPVPAAPAEPPGLGAGLASAVSGTGGLLTGLVAGLWWRRRPRLLPPPPFDPPTEPVPAAVPDDEYEPVSGTLPIPVVLPSPRPEPSTAEHAIIVVDTAETQVIAAVRPGTRFRLRLGQDGEPGAGTLVVDGEHDGS